MQMPRTHMNDSFCYEYVKKKKKKKQYFITYINYILYEEIKQKIEESIT